MEQISNHGEQFNKVYDEVFPVLLKVVYKITGSLDIAEELCQEAFIRFYERMEDFPDINQAKYWLIRVSKNLALNHQKRKGREKRAYERAIHEPGRNDETGETAILKKESYYAVQKALDRLPENLKTVLILKEYGNLNYKEIAKTLKISEGNVKVRVFRARKQLFDYLNNGEFYVP